ncbi:MAG: hypothetical protein JWM64_1694 [Frankiales bacterium]|nr:hypothetical protein [Frankiales bacterium]
MLLTRPALGVVLVMGCTLAAVAAPALGAATLSFDATVDATTGRYTVTVPGGPVADTIVDAGGNRAQSRLSSTGSSTAVASAPYPGDVVLGAPGLASTFGVPVPVPEYPAYAQSSNPSRKEQVVVEGPITVSARSTEAASTGKAVVGAAGATSSEATASVQQDGAEVVAEGETLVRGVELGPIKIDAVVSRAVATRSPKGLTTSSTLRAVGLTVAGQAVTLDDRGLTLAGTTVPLGAAAPLVAAAERAGVSMRYLAPRKTPTGVVSGGLELSSTQAVPQVPGGPAVEEGTVTLVLGQTSASIAGAAFDDTVAPTGGPPPATGNAPDAAEAPPAAADQPVAAGDDPAAAPSADDAPAVQAGVLDPPAGDAGAAAAPAGADPAPALADQQQVQLLAARGAPDAWSASFYVALAAGAVLSLLALTLVRLLGVRYP